MTRSKKNKNSMGNLPTKQLVSMTMPTVKREAKKLAKEAVDAIIPKMGGMLSAKLGLGETVGRKAGSKVAQRINRLMGSGDYVVGGAPVVNTLIKGQVSITDRFLDRRVRLTHREYIGEVITGGTIGAFNALQYVVNADTAGTFPYLSSLATNYEQYKFHGLVFEFVSTCSPYLSTSAMGSVIMAAQMNVSNPTFQSKAQMENCENAVSARMDQCMMFGVECETQVQQYYYTRHIGANPTPNTNVANVFDFCNFSIATTGGGIAANTVVGELWVSYDVELVGPRLPDIRQGYYHLTTATGVTSAKPLGSSWNTPAGWGILSTVTNTSTVLSFNNVTSGDTYLCIYAVASSTAAGGNGTLTLTGTNCTTSGANSWGNYTSGAAFVGTTSQISSAFFVQVNAPNASITFATTNVGTGTVSMDLVLVPVGFSVAISYF